MAQNNDDFNFSQDNNQQPMPLMNQNSDSVNYPQENNQQTFSPTQQAPAFYPVQPPIYVPPVFKNEEMELSDWLLTLFLLDLPFVGFILMIVWACSSNIKFKQRSNYAKASLLYMIIKPIVILILSGILLGIVALLAGTGIFEELFYGLAEIFEDIAYEIEDFFYYLF